MSIFSNTAMWKDDVTIYKNPEPTRQGLFISDDQLALGWNELVSTS